VRSGTIAEWVAALTERLETGALKQLGVIPLGDSTSMDAELAVRIILADVDDLVQRARQHISIPATRWRSVVELLVHLDTLTSGNDSLRI
jgi:hypothetical protein